MSFTDSDSEEHRYRGVSIKELRSRVPLGSSPAFNGDLCSCDCPFLAWGFPGSETFPACLRYGGAKINDRVRCAECKHTGGLLAHERPEGFVWGKNRFAMVVKTKADAVAESIAKWEWIRKHSAEILDEAKKSWPEEGRLTWVRYGGTCALCWFFGDRAERGGAVEKCTLCPLNDGTHPRWCCSEYVTFYVLLDTSYSTKRSELNAAIDAMLAALRDIRDGNPRRKWDPYTGLGDVVTKKWGES